MTGDSPAEPPPPPIDIGELEAMLLDPDVPESRIRPYLVVDPSESSAFRPVVRVDPARVDVIAAQSALALSALNGIARWRRALVFARRRPGHDGPVAVSEGDSWFQYPFLLDDVIDQLGDDFLIYSLGGAGHLLSEMVAQDELVGAIAAEKPDIVFFSGGGNDLLGEGRLAQHVHLFEEGRAPEDYPKDSFAGLLSDALDQYGKILEDSLAAGAPRIVCHSYAYAVPASGRWLGRPLASLGIVDPALQRDIVAAILDRFHAGLSDLIAEPGFRGRVVLADVRNEVGPRDWYDELHPTDDGFRRVAAVFRSAARGEEAPRVAVAGAPVPEGPITPEWTDPARLLEHDEEVLLAELGRRASVMRVRPEVAGLAAAPVEAVALEGISASFVTAGRELLDRVHRELHEVICGDPDAAGDERRRLEERLGLEEGAVVAALASIMIGSLGIAPFLAPLIAAILYKAGIEPTVDLLCERWARAFDAGAVAPVSG